MEQYSADIICMSESWERGNLSLGQMLQFDNYGKPAILVDIFNYIVKIICPALSVGVQGSLVPSHTKKNDQQQVQIHSSLLYALRRPKVKKEEGIV